MASFKDLQVWQRSIELVTAVYELCSQLPIDERFGLCSQMQRASVSVPSNIAEGYRRHGRQEYKQFCGIALGSCAELETQLIVTNNIYPEANYAKALDLCIEVQKMLTILITKL